MKAVAFDLDGVICKTPVRAKILMIMSYILMVVPQIRFLYDKFCRQIDRRIAYFIRYLRREEIKVYIVTGNTPAYKKKLEQWLKRRGIFYNQMYCFSSNCGLTVAQWKAEMAMKLNVDLFVEDLPQIADHLRSCGIKVILYTGENIDELWRRI